MFTKVGRGIHTTFEIIQTVRSSKIASNVIDFINFALGFVGLHNLIQTYYFKEREIEELYADLPSWQQSAWKIADHVGNLSLILSSMKSRTAIAIWQWSIQKIVSPEQFERFFGRQGHIPGEKVHKAMGIMSLLLGIPPTLKTFFAIYTWINQPHSPREEQDEHFYTPINVRKIDIVITVQTVTETAQKLMSTPRK